MGVLWHTLVITVLYRLLCSLQSMSPDVLVTSTDSVYESLLAMPLSWMDLKRGLWPVAACAKHGYLEHRQQVEFSHLEPCGGEPKEKQSLSPE